MKVLFIGGTGNISATVSRLCVEKGVDLYHLNRGHGRVTMDGVTTLIADIHDSVRVAEVLEGHQWDSVVNWIAFTSGDIERDIQLFQDKTNQYIFISSATVYHKPPLTPFVTESTPRGNPFSEYAQNKIACEECLEQAYRDTGFPYVIVRPSHTYDTMIPITIGGSLDYNVVDRILKGKEIIIHGDGTSLWTMTHADDFARGFMGLIGRSQTIGESFHITSDEVLTWNQIYEALARAVGCKAKLVHVASDYLCDMADSMGQTALRGSLLGDKAYSVIFDNSKIKRFVPDYEASITFREGIRRTLDWFQADPSRMRIDPDKEAFIEAVLQSYPASIRR